MDERITELESVALAARANNGRMDSASRDKASALLASIWADPAIDPAPTLQLMEELKAEPIAEALRSCWPRMDISRKNLFRRWVPAPSTEKSYRRLTFLVASIIEIDGATALDWLGLLIPSDRRSVSKEARGTLATILFGQRTLSFETLMHESSSGAELLRICAALFDIAADPILSVSTITRARLASAILTYLAGPDPYKDNLAVSDLRAKINADSKRWPPALRNQVIPVGEARHDPQSAVSSFDVVAEAQPERKAGGETNAPTSRPVAVGPLEEELPRLAEELSNRICAITQEVDFLRRADECVAMLVESAKQEVAQREAANREVQRVKELLRIAESERDRAKADSAQESQRASDLVAALEQMKVDRENELKRLGQQISANANGRIVEFKNRLGLNLSRLVVDLPGKEVQVSLELGRVLLLQFHQFLDALRQEGIETLSTKVVS